LSASTLKLPSPKRRALLDQATEEYNESLALALNYLTSRGLDEETAQRWKLGYVLDPLPGHERFKGYLSVPYLTKAGTVAMKFRCIRDHQCEGHGKYDGEKGQGTFLFGAMSFWVDSPFICLVEGELDAISCSIAGLPAVGVPGGSQWRTHWQFCFEGYDEVIALQDGFKEGDKARDTFASNVTSRLHNVRVVEFAAGEDSNSFLVEHGPQALREKVLGHE